MYQIMSINCSEHFFKNVKDANLKDLDLNHFNFLP